MKTTEEKIKDIIAEQIAVNPEDLGPEKEFEGDLGCDSLDMVELVIAYEENFEVEIPDEDAEKFITVGDVVKYITDKVSA